jgi:hypothetical protein
LATSAIRTAWVRSTGIDDGLAARRAVGTFGLRGELDHQLIEADLSRGWQMRSPFHVRQDELLSAFSGQPARARDVITLEPEAAFVEAAEMPPALYAAMLDDEPIDAKEVRQKTQRWADVHHALALQAREQSFSREQTRERMQAALLADLRDEVAAAAAGARFDAARIGAWLLDEFPGELGRMPYLGRLSEVLYERLRNPYDVGCVNWFRTPKLGLRLEHPFAKDGRNGSSCCVVLRDA